jgi:transcriptional regulator with XRE-family HTH domain
MRLVARQNTHNPVDVIRARRKGPDLRLSQAQLAERAGVSLSTIQRLERGQRPAAEKEQFIDEALGWEPGGIDTVFNGGEPTSVTEAPEIPSSGTSTHLDIYTASWEQLVRAAMLIRSVDGQAEAERWLSRVYALRAAAISDHKEDQVNAR